MHQVTATPLFLSFSLSFTPLHYSYLSLVSNIHELTIYAEAACDTNSITAMQRELQVLKDNNIWVLTTLPEVKRFKIYLSKPTN